jgi:hypothetical protein
MVAPFERLFDFDDHFPQIVNKLWQIFELVLRNSLLPYQKALLDQILLQKGSRLHFCIVTIVENMHKHFLPRRILLDIDLIHMCQKATVDTVWNHIELISFPAEPDGLQMFPVYTVRPNDSFIGTIVLFFNYLTPIDLEPILFKNIIVQFNIPLQQNSVPWPLSVDEKLLNPFLLNFLEHRDDGIRRKVFKLRNFPYQFIANMVVLYVQTVKFQATGNAEVEVR